MPSFSASLDSSSKIGTVALALTDVEVSINNPTGEKVLVWAQADVDWYLDTTDTTPNTERVFVAMKQIFPVVLDQKSASVFHVKGSAVGTLVLWQPE